MDGDTTSHSRINNGMHVEYGSRRYGSSNYFLVRVRGSNFGRINNQNLSASTPLAADLDSSVSQKTDTRNIAYSFVKDKFD